MKLEKPIVFFDVETTGLSTTKDRIVELFMLKENIDGTKEEFYSRFNPSPIEVGESAVAVHGISMEDLKNEPAFSEKTEEILNFIRGCDISGYNVLHFDIPILFEEFHRAGKLFNYRNYRIFDCYRMWTLYEPRTLTGAYKRFINKDMKGAHQAKNDVFASREIFNKQIEEWLGNESLDDIFNHTTELNKKIDLAGKFARNESNEIILTFGKHANKPISQVSIDDPEYFRWMYEKAEMPTDTKMIAQKIYTKMTNKNG